MNPHLHGVRCLIAPPYYCSPRQGIMHPPRLPRHCSLVTERSNRLLFFLDMFLLYDVIAISVGEFSGRIGVISILSVRYQGAMG